MQGLIRGVKEEGVIYEECLKFYRDNIHVIHITGVEGVHTIIKIILSIFDSGMIAIEVRLSKKA